jgi:hypothetical protein
MNWRRAAALFGVLLFVMLAGIQNRPPDGAVSLP